MEHVRAEADEGNSLSRRERQEESAVTVGIFNDTAEDDYRED